jgi:hypothetical protein
VCSCSGYNRFTKACACVLLSGSLLIYFLREYAGWECEFTLRTAPALLDDARRQVAQPATSVGHPAAYFTVQGTDIRSGSMHRSHVLPSGQAAGAQFAAQQRMAVQLRKAVHSTSDPSHHQ